MIKTYALRLAIVAVSLGTVAASANEGDCVRCDLTAGVMQVKCQSGFSATALICINDVTYFISYLEDQGRICPPLPATREEQDSDLLKVVGAMITESRDRPEAEAVEVVYQALAEDYPCK